MTESNKSISPLRHRMIEDMTMRKLSPKTQAAYIRAVVNFTGFLKHSPDTADAEDLWRYQLRLVTDGTSRITVNATITGLKFFFEVTLDRGDVTRKMSPVYEPRRLPVVLSVEEVTRFLDGAPNLKAKAALSVAYGAGLRASEVVHLKVSDIDRERGAIRVEQGKGRKDRYAMLSPTLHALLHAWWLAVSRPEPGQPDDHPSTQPHLSQGGGCRRSAYPCTLCTIVSRRTCLSRRWTSAPPV